MKKQVYIVFIESLAMIDSVHASKDLAEKRIKELKKRDAKHKKLDYSIENHEYEDCEDTVNTKLDVLIQLVSEKA